MNRSKVDKAQQDPLAKNLQQQVFLHKRRVALKKVLFNYMGLTLSREQSLLSLEDIGYAGLSDELYTVVAELGLSRGELPLESARIDIEVNGVAIAFDDELKFTRSRMLTLASPIYNLPLIYNLNRYKKYCQENLFTESPLLLDGRKVKRGSSFYNAGGGHVEKLRALNDFMQDMLPLVHYMPLLRLSAYDQLESPEGPLSLNAILSDDKRKHYELLADYLVQQLDDLESTFQLEF